MNIDKNYMQKFGYVSLMGETNSGKSTLLNSILGYKISIVSRKVQTTRNHILGIHHHNNTQIVYIDNPGIFNPTRDFDHSMIKHAYSSLKFANIVAIMVDVNKGLNKYFQEIIESAKRHDIPCIVILNKIDTIEKNKLLTLATELNNKYHIDDIFMISALKNDGVLNLVEYFAKNMPDGMWRYSPEYYTNAPLRFIFEEITREHIYNLIHQEVPYNIGVATDKLIESKKEIKIYQSIFINKSSYKSIILGKNGEKIKSISISARKEIQQYTDKRVSLYLFVKLKKDFMHNVNFHNYLNT